MVHADIRGTGESWRDAEVHQSLYQAQTVLYQYFLSVVQTENAETTICLFRTLFFHQVDSTDAPALPALYALVSAQAEDLFQQAIKRICYILINNWHSQRNSAAIAAFFELFSDPVLYRPAASESLTRLRGWLVSFIQSQDFRELQLHRPDLREGSHSWVQRYTAYLLAAQSYNSENPYEQRRIAHAQVRAMREKFKFSLAMYTASDRSATSRHQNPTALDENALRLIRKILVRRGPFDYKHLAKIFLKQSQDLKFAQFKQGLLRYLLFTMQKNAAEDLIQTHLGRQIREIYGYRDQDVVDDALILRTANRVIDACTLDSAGHLSPFLNACLEAEDVLTPVIVLLRILLISPRSQAHLDTRMAGLIEGHALEDEDSCRPFIQFLEILRIATTIYFQNVEYSLVAMDLESKPAGTESYRFFSLCRLPAPMPD